VASLLDEYSLVSFVPLDISDEDSIGDVLLQVRISVNGLHEPFEPHSHRCHMYV
jgi:hypothetical protein